jgi:hypothetical protein
MPCLIDLARRLDNVQLVDEVASDAVPGPLEQCRVGLIALDPRHVTQNIPVKLLTHLLAGLPVLVRISPGNDLAALINDEGVGFVFAMDQQEEVKRCAEELLAGPSLRATMREPGGSGWSSGCCRRRWRWGDVGRVRVGGTQLREHATLRQESLSAAADAPQRTRNRRKHRMIAQARHSP